MKKFIRTIDEENDFRRRQIQEHLNGLGFYVLSGDKQLHVYMIENTINGFDKLLSWIFK